MSKRLLLFLIAVLPMFFACGKDDDVKNDNELLVGKWYSDSMYVNIEGYDLSMGLFDEDDTLSLVEFMEDGTFTLTYSYMPVEDEDDEDDEYDDEDEEYATYKITGSYSYYRATGTAEFYDLTYMTSGDGGILKVTPVFHLNNSGSFDLSLMLPNLKLKFFFVRATKGIDLTTRF